MKLSQYIKYCQDIFDKHGDIDKFFTQKDDEGNGFNPTGYAPELRYIEKNSESRSGCVDRLIQDPSEFESLEEWAEESYLDLEDDGTFDMSTLTKVILL